jgi:hypothetical protein
LALRALLRRMTFMDRGIVLILLLGAVVSMLLLAKDSQGKRVVVEQDGRVVFTAPLNIDRIVPLKGPIGETVLSIRNGRARIISSDCPLKICMGMGEVEHAGELLACVPNHLLVHIEGDAEGNRKDYDLLSR